MPMEAKCCMNMRDLTVQEFYTALVPIVLAMPAGIEKTDLIKRLVRIDLKFLDLLD